MISAQPTRLMFCGSVVQTTVIMHCVYLFLIYLNKLFVIWCIISEMISSRFQKTKLPKNIN